MHWFEIECDNYINLECVVKFKIEDYHKDDINDDTPCDVRVFYTVECGLMPELFKGVRYCELKRAMEGSENLYGGIEAAIREACDEMKESSSAAAASIVEAIGYSAPEHGDVEDYKHNLKRIANAIESIEVPDNEFELERIEKAIRDGSKSAEAAAPQPPKKKKKKKKTTS